jgi:rod shape determining protein RodA
MKLFSYENHTTFDTLLVTSAILLSLLGLVTMHSFIGTNDLFMRQAVWIVLGIACMYAVSFLDMRTLRTTSVITALFIGTALLLILVLFFGSVTLGAKNRFDLGFFAFQPGDVARLVLVLTLAKYFARRHLDIAHITHIFVSGLYALIFFFFLFLEPDFGSGAIIFCIWLGMVLVAGISKKHLAFVFLAGVCAGAVLWFGALQPYQKQRVVSFLHPLADIRGAGYNAYQSTIAVGSGEILGKGIGQGSQSKLSFLPEYETDFIFAAFAEEWGLVGVALLFILFGILFWRIVVHAEHGATNFETLFCVGVLLWFFAQVSVHVGMNMGLLPVTGTTIPFLSYGGSHLVVEYIALGIILAMHRYEHSVGREFQDREILGAVQ